MSPADLAALRRLVDILEGPRPEEVPAEALHAVALIEGWTLEKGLRDRWLLNCPFYFQANEVTRAILVEVLGALWLARAREMLKSEAER